MTITPEETDKLFECLSEIESNTEIIASQMDIIIDLLREFIQSKLLERK